MSTRKHYALRLSLTIPVLLLGLQPVLADTPAEFLITLGVGIGRITLGVNITDAAKIMGTPKATITRGEAVFYTWFDYVSTLVSAP